MHAYAAVYLLSHGFSNTLVGILLAVANVLSAVIQPMIAGIIDKPGWLTNRRFILTAMSGMLIGALLLMIVPDNKAATFIIYVIIYMLQFAYQPVMTAICFEYQKAGHDIFYGLARGLGSAGFAVTAAIIGGVVERHGTTILMIVTAVVMAISLVVVYFFRIPGEGDATKGSDDAASSENAEPVGNAHNNVRDFARTYPAFTLFLAVAVCFFFAHNMINDFMIQIIRNLGGGETELGLANFLQAILELPVMALSGFVLKKITSDKLLLTSGVAFLVKTIIMLLAVNLAMMYLSQSFQLFAYAVFIPASAYYVSQTMEPLDQVKGQAYVTSAITVGGVFSNLISGAILDHFGVRAMLSVGSVVCAIGVVIAFVAFSRLPHYQNNDK